MIHQLTESKVDNPGKHQVQTHYAKCGLVGVRYEHQMSAWQSDVTCKECKC